MSSLGEQLGNCADGHGALSRMDTSMSFGSFQDCASALAVKGIGPASCVCKELPDRKESGFLTGRAKTSHPKSMINATTTFVNTTFVNS